MAGLGKPIGEYDRVRLWTEDYEKSWGEGSADPARLRALEEFCEFVGKDPDTIVGECLAPADGGYEKIRYKGRREYIRLIAEFEAQSPAGREAANAVRSFMIHNGVAMGTHILR